LRSWPRAGIAFDRVGVTVPFGAPDDVWLSHCGKHSYLALTRDERIRYRSLEKQALIEHGVACFTFTQVRRRRPSALLAS
jgi:hypothetical protein